MKNILFLFLFYLLFPALTFSSQNYSKEEPSMKVEEVSPNEDLMREHGILLRIFVIYEEISRRIDNNKEFKIQSLFDSINITKNFIENYHEKLEEDYIFPKFVKAHKQMDLIYTLKKQHDAGRKLTDQLITLTKEETLKDNNKKNIISNYLKAYVKMFNPHIAREDTVLFPEFKKLISDKEYNEFGEAFESKEHELFGEGGFENIVKQVADIEKSLDIYNLNNFTFKK